MRFKGFHIKNFKGIRDLTINLESQIGSNIFTLVGVNESGKTTILEAINFFQDYLQIPKDKRYIYLPKSVQLNYYDEISVTAVIDVSDADMRSIKRICKEERFVQTTEFSELSITRGYKFRSSNFDTIINQWDVPLCGKLRTSHIEKNLGSDTITWKNIVEQIVTRMIPRIVYYENFLFNWPQAINLEPYEGEEKEQRSYRLVLQDILDSLGDNLDLVEQVLDRLKSNEFQKQASLRSVQGKMGGKINDVITKKWANILKSQNKRILVNTEVIHNNAESQYQLQITMEEGSDPYQISERSLGFRWFFSFLLFTEFRKERKSDNGEILFLLDEPASNLHSSSQEELLKSFNTIFLKSKLIYTTHSRHLINPEWLGNTYIILNKAIKDHRQIDYNTSQSDIVADTYRNYASQGDSRQSYFQPVLDALDYHPSKLEWVPRIIVVEGKNDYYR